MRLSDAQQDFALDIAYLIQHINIFDNHRYSCTFSDAYRDPRVHGELGDKQSYSSANSKHKLRLAVDLNLFKDGIYQPDGSAHEPFADYWEALHPDNVNGRGWNDANHYQRNQ